MSLQIESQRALDKIPAGTVSWRSSRMGYLNGEPLLCALDGMLRYAKAYALRYDSKLSNDGALGDEWLSAVKGLRGLLNGDGAVAMEKNISTDSKDNGACEAIFWAAMEAAGFDESSL